MRCIVLVLDGKYSGWQALESGVCFQVGDKCGLRGVVLAGPLGVLSFTSKKAIIFFTRWLPFFLF
jgi:hypothetical protein